MNEILGKIKDQLKDIPQDVGMAITVITVAIIIISLITYLS